MRVGEGVDNASASLFDDTDAALNFPNMLPSRGKVEGGFVKVGPHLLELIVHENCLDRETGAVVDAHNTL